MICDITFCHKRSIGTFEDMRDGEWVELCNHHAKKMMEFGWIR